MATAQLYHYMAPKEEMTVIAKPLIRLLRSYRYEFYHLVVVNNTEKFLEKYKALSLATLPPSPPREM